MPDKRTHRGPGPEDAELFAADKLPALRAAVNDHSMLLTKGYAEKSALKLVGDHFSLTQRQRIAVQRCSCSDAQLAGRKERQVESHSVSGEAVIIDGYNILITIEACLSGAAVFCARDGCFRDLAGIHGSYRKVTETIPALEVIAEKIQDLEISHALWLFDSPVSNSGRLKTIIYELIEKNNWPFDVELLQNPDTELIAADKIIATSDSDVLDKCSRWINLNAYIIGRETCANIVDLSI
jgi:hypothetical protein